MVRSPNETVLGRNHSHGKTLTLAFIVNAALRLGLKLGPDVVEQLVQALAGPALRHHGARGRIAVIHGWKLVGQVAVRGVPICGVALARWRVIEARRSW